MSLLRYKQSEFRNTYRMALLVKVAIFLFGTLSFCVQRLQASSTRNAATTAKPTPLFCVPFREPLSYNRKSVKEECDCLLKTECEITLWHSCPNRNQCWFSQQLMSFRLDFCTTNFLAKNMYCLRKDGRNTLILYWSNLCPKGYNRCNVDTLKLFFKQFCDFWMRACYPYLLNSKDLYSGA